MCKRPTIDSLIKQQEELIHSTVHLLAAQVQQGNNLEIHLPEEVCQLVHVGHGCTQLSVVQVVHVADQESNFVCGCGGEDRASKYYLNEIHNSFTYVDFNL